MLPKLSPKSPPYYQASNLAAISGLYHGFFTRRGGVTTLPFCQSLDGSHRSPPQDRKENIQLAREALVGDDGFPPFTYMGMHQVHGARCITVPLATTPSLEASNASCPEADALTTNLPRWMLGVITADCVPLLMADPEARVAAAVHAGWRGASLGVVTSTLEAMLKLGARRPAIRAAIGPCIDQRHYQVGQDVLSAFDRRAPRVNTPSGSIFRRFFRPSGPGKWNLDLGGLVAWQLRNQGIDAVEILPLDTYSNPDDFFSCRRATHLGEPTFGCQISMIGFR